jgi:hypothetical protein
LPRASKKKKEAVDFFSPVAHVFFVPPPRDAVYFDSIRYPQEYHPFFMGNDYIGPAVDHFQEITAQYPEVSALSKRAMMYPQKRSLPTGGREVHHTQDLTDSRLQTRIALLLFIFYSHAISIYRPAIRRCLVQNRHQAAFDFFGD